MMNKASSETVVQLDNFRKWVGYFPQTHKLLIQRGGSHA